MVSYVTDLEEIIEIVSDWAVATVNEVTDTLLEDGRPFDTVELPIEDQIEDYLQIRGNPSAWMKHISDLQEQVMNKLQEGGLSPDQIASVHPAQIALAFAAQYSIRMEKEIGRRGNLHEADAGQGTEGAGVAPDISSVPALANAEGDQLTS